MIIDGNPYNEEAYGHIFRCDDEYGNFIFLADIIVLDYEVYCEIP